MSKLVRVDIYAPEDLQDRITVFLAQNAAHGWEEMERDGRLIFRVHLEKVEYAEMLRHDLLMQYPMLEVETGEIENADWSVAWREFFTPVTVKPSFQVLAPWMKEELQQNDLIKIIIEPRTAFGTGHHQSTFLCLKAIADLFENGRIKVGQNFLDLGTGSGILGLACAKLGLCGIGVDIDPIAVDNALENRALNGVGPEFEIIQGSTDDLPDRSFDLIIANILSEPLIAMAPDLSGALKSSGYMILSGILSGQADKVCNAYLRQGLLECGRLAEGEWAALLFHPSAR